MQSGTVKTVPYMVQRAAGMQSHHVGADIRRPWLSGKYIPSGKYMPSKKYMSSGKYIPSENTYHPKIYVILSAAKDLSPYAQKRSFAALRMTTRPDINAGDAQFAPTGAEESTPRPKPRAQRSAPRSQNKQRPLQSGHCLRGGAMERTRKRTSPKTGSFSRERNARRRVRSGQFRCCSFASDSETPQMRRESRRSRVPAGRLCRPRMLNPLGVERPKGA